MTIAQRLLAPFGGRGDKPSAKSCPVLPLPLEPKILAHSAVDRNQQRIFELRNLDRKLCEDRRTLLEHLGPKMLVKNVSVTSANSATHMFLFLVLGPNCYPPFFVRLSKLW